MVRISLLLVILFTFPLHAKNCTKEVIRELLELYPTQSKKMIKLRIENAKNKHMFMRAFIPYYYREAYKVRKTIPAYQKLKQYTGQIVGDAHVGNFGFMVDNKGKSILTLNDFDDVAEAPLFLDVMRLSQSASYVGDFNQVRFLEAYKRGLAGNQHKMSPYVSKLSEKSSKGGMTTKAEYTQTPEGARFTSRTEPASNATKNQIVSLDNILKKKFGKNVKLHDAYITMKESGGSAFGKRYHALMELDGNIHLVEFKEIMDGGVVAAWVKKPVSNEDRILNARKSFLGKNFDQRIDVVDIDGSSFQLRFKAKGNKSIDVKEMDEAEAAAVIEDEFFVLGQLHRKSLETSNGNVEEYVRDFGKVTAEEWDESVKIMKKKVKEAYDKGNP